MKKLWLFIVLFLCVASVSAVNLKDIQVMNVKNCYNLTVHYELEDGDPTAVSFSGCKDWGNQTWFCNCHNDDNSYNLIMRTDRTIIRDAREYKLTVKGYVYSFESDSKTIRLLDWGDYSDVKTSNVDDFGEDAVCREGTTEFIYVNRTVEVPVEITKEVRVEVPVDRVVYVENTTRIDQLENESNNFNTSSNEWRNKAKVRGVWAWIVTVLLVPLLIFFVRFTIFTGGEA